MLLLMYFLILLLLCKNLYVTNMWVYKIDMFSVFFFLFLFLFFVLLIFNNMMMFCNIYIYIRMHNTLFYTPIYIQCYICWRRKPMSLFVIHPSCVFEICISVCVFFFVLLPFVLVVSMYLMSHDVHSSMTRLNWSSHRWRVEMSWMKLGSWGKQKTKNNTKQLNKQQHKTKHRRLEQQHSLHNSLTNKKYCKQKQHPKQHTWQWMCTLKIFWIIISQCSFS